MDRNRQWTALAVAVGALGAVLAFAIEADLGLADGIWYPVVYACVPAVAATAAFAHERPGESPVLVATVGGWLLVTSVLALAGFLVLSLGFPPRTARPPIVALGFVLALYLGYLLVPVAAALAAGRTRGIRAIGALALAPVGQLLVGAVLVVLR
ncbi:hypothetical protein EGH21_02855 [Halomicroarcula sp. F13]|uniref:Uncharacterized protein n=1 Tax=Haloarcula rubra TaxID=2487747 RepID=A0AAW4PN39_9EURY|nr:hypothetical protein [Halomicroarcula rubra]MBX0321965.1 hypothetical protein [Halomicroarcula rubra]